VIVDIGIEIAMRWERLDPDSDSDSDSDPDSDPDPAGWAARGTVGV